MKKFDIIWIIDDDPIYTFGAKRKLKQINISKSVRALDNGKEALEELHHLAITEKSKLPDLILLDINMPHMDGWQFLKELENMSLKVDATVYLVTSSVDPRDIEKARASRHVCGYLNKPLQTENILGILEEVNFKK
ncbi:response regulator [Salegentibacter sp. JZCK2]|uniref:response regulator n=1 Tax=Salegentibacter tibetensis TaxID=2873600 RepID=UPI001CCF2FD5|nr:response regulator [Salegentibacter tibetensis]MBZ9731373.1 response regulator [Salegentibacter tibetensis]